MTETWGETGVGRHFKHKLSTSTKEHIKREIESQNKQPKYGYEKLFSDLEIAISQFKTQNELAELSSPGAVRNNLGKALNAALKLNEALNNLDGNSRQLLSQYKGIRELQGTHLSAIIEDLAKAKTDSNKYPSRGRLPASRRIILVLQLDHILSTHIDCPLTTTKVSLFSNILTLVYEEATGRSEIKNVHELLRDAKKKWERVENPDGVIEFRPKDTN